LLVTEKLTMTKLHVLLIRTGVMNVTCLLVPGVFLTQQEVDLSVVTSQHDGMRAINLQWHLVARHAD